MAERELVRLITVDSVEPVEGADALDRVTVGGWHVVSQKGLYNPGDQAFYHEIDSLLPLDNPAYEFLKTRGIKEVDGKQYHRLKTIKLRGQISQGLLVPWKVFEDDYYDLSWANHGLGFEEEQISFTNHLGILKYDDVVTVNAGNGDTAGSFPTKYGNKTDAERIQNLARHWDAIKQEFWVPSEKIDGCSLSVFRDEDGNLRVCSRNWEVREGDNVYWNAVRQFSNIFTNLNINAGIQAEIYGEGIQKNRLGVKGVHIAIFNYLEHGEALGYGEWPDWLVYSGDEHFAPIPTDSNGHTLQLPDTIEDVIAQADGIKSKISKDRLAEGIVWTNPDGIVLPFLGRHCWKVISNSYLLKEK